MRSYRGIRGIKLVESRPIKDRTQWTIARIKAPTIADISLSQSISVPRCTLAGPRVHVLRSLAKRSLITSVVASTASTINARNNDYTLPFH